jgi:drug/metabolite transporter (DMT)-like permease
VSSTALLLVFAAAVAHAAWNIVAHGVSRLGVPFIWWGAVVSTVLWSLAIPFTGWLGTDDLAGVALGFSISGVLHVAYMLVLQRGYASGRLSTVYATARGTGPLLSASFALLFLGEHVGVLALVGVLIIIGGVVAIGLVDRSPEAAERRRGPDPAIVFGLLTGVAIAAYTLWDTTAIRTWGISPVAYMVGTTLVEVPIYTLAMGRRRRELGAVWRQHWKRVITFGVLSPLSYILVLTAITIAPVALVAPLREVSVVLVSLWGAFVLRDARPLPRLIASAAVVAGIVLLAL